MKRTALVEHLSLWLTLVALCGSRLVAAPLVDDRAITIKTASDVKHRRAALVQFVWGSDGFPTRRLPDVVHTNVPTPVRSLTNLARIDELRIRLAPGLEGLAYHFIPQKPNRQLVIVHHGHACTLDDAPSADQPGYGLQPTINALLADGCGVLGIFMPRMRPGDCAGGHDKIFEIPTVGSPMRFFLEPTAVSLNHVKKGRDGPRYRSFHMIGLSGGGWTTTLYAALDPNISLSFPVAGSIPLYLRTGGSVGDLEQFLPDFYRLAGYPDLYVLGSHGRKRAQVQIVVRRDDCCFGEAQHDAGRAGLPYAEAFQSYATGVQRTLQSAGASAESFRLVIDETAPRHMISDAAIQRFILPELRRAR